MRSSSSPSTPRESEKPLRLRAHAKLNLALRVGERREDGYHPIASVFQTINLCDLLVARHAERGAPGSLSLQVVGADLPADNTVRAAVDGLAREALRLGIEPGPLHMTLVKRVPMGAGLGGGSSDAVTALAACARLWKLDRGGLDRSGALRRIAAEVGSDVPFFLRGGTAMVGGRGERVERLDSLIATWFVVAAPDVQVSTPVAYEAFDRSRQQVSARDSARDTDGSAAVGGAPPLPPYEPRPRAHWMGNDLQAPVSAGHPEIERVRQRLAGLGAHIAQMTGSGSASFGVFADRRSATRAARALRAEARWAGAFVSINGKLHRRGLWGV